MTPDLFIEELTYGVQQKKWLLSDGSYHRLDGPAFVRCDPHFPERISPSGIQGLEREGWYFFGKMHRVDGPAETWFDGIDFHFHWWYHGRMYLSAAEWFDAMSDADKIKAMWNINFWKNLK